MDVARMNMSHGAHETHKATIENIRRIEILLGRDVAVAIDTKGPELRARTYMHESVHIEAGDELLITNGDVTASKNVISIPLQSLLQTKEGTTIFIDDGHLAVVAVGVREGLLVALAQNAHVLHSGKGVNIPGMPLNVPILSEDDRDDIIFGLENRADAIFISFVSRASDVVAVREFLADKCSEMPEIISKIESAEGLRNLEGILDVSDGVMVARGDLAVEIGHEHVFRAQKIISRSCLEKKKVLICATQMLESMTDSRYPTRAEVSDVGNAVLDGCDCVMLSGETACGRYPVETVAMMRKICIEAERLRGANRHESKHREDGDIAAEQRGGSEEEAHTEIILHPENILEVDIARHEHPCASVLINSADRKLLRKAQLRKGCFRSTALG